jgi:hypothetical protein
MGTDLRLQLSGPPSPSYVEALIAERVRSGSLAVSSLKVGSDPCDDACAALDHRALVPVEVFQGQDG